MMNLSLNLNNAEAAIFEREIADIKEITANVIASSRDGAAVSHATTVYRLFSIMHTQLKQHAQDLRDQEKRRRG